MAIALWRGCLVAPAIDCTNSLPGAHFAPRVPFFHSSVGNGIPGSICDRAAEQRHTSAPAWELEWSVRRWFPVRRADSPSPATLLRTASAPTCRFAVVAASSLGMKKENPSSISVSIFYYRKQEREWNCWVRERKRDITVTETGGNRKIYRNALLINHHSLCMNVTLDTPLHKLFFKKYYQYFLFPTIKPWNICIDIEKHERIYGVPIIYFSDFTNTEKIQEYPG